MVEALFFSTLFLAFLGFVVFIRYLLKSTDSSNRLLRFFRDANRGEGIVRTELTRSFNSPNYHLLNNITLPFGDGTTQIDHILISTKGIFVIETKHYSGWIFADANSPTWMQTIYRQKNKFPNPIRQNYRHVKAIQKLLDFVPPDQIYSIVIFTGDAEFKTEIPKGVFKLQQVRDHLLAFQEDVITTNRMQFCVGRIECTRYQISKKTDVEHQEYLRRKFGSL